MLSCMKHGQHVEGMMMGPPNGALDRKADSRHRNAKSATTETPEEPLPAEAFRANIRRPSLPFDLNTKDLHIAMEMGDELGVPIVSGVRDATKTAGMARRMASGPRRSSFHLRVYGGHGGHKVNRKPARVCRTGYGIDR